MRVISFIGVVALLSGIAQGQSTEAAPAFEAADVHVSKTGSPFPYMKGPFLRSGLYEVRTATMVDLIAEGYGVAADKVVGGPSWLEMDRFDLVGRVPATSRPGTHTAT